MSLPRDLTPEQQERFVALTADDNTLRRGWECKSASLDGPRRYTLTRGEPPFLGLVMLNPSTADGFTDDPTIRKCKGFAARMGLKGIAVANLFTLRTPEPRELLAKLEAGEAVSTPACDAALGWVCNECDVLVFAWGALSKPLARWAEVRNRSGIRGRRPSGQGADGAWAHRVRCAAASTDAELHVGDGSAQVARCPVEPGALARGGWVWSGT